MYNNPEGFEEQGNASLPKRQDRYIRSITIGTTHQVPGCPRPDFL